MNMLTQDQIQAMAAKRKGRFMTKREAAEATGVPLYRIHEMRKAGVLVPDAKLASGNKGRPAFLYKPSSVKAAYKAYRSEQVQVLA